MDGGRRDLLVTGGIMAAGFAAVWLLWPQSDPSGLPAELRCGDTAFVREHHGSLEECLRKEGAEDMLKGKSAAGKSAPADPASAPPPAP